MGDRDRLRTLLARAETQLLNRRAELNGLREQQEAATELLNRIQAIHGSAVESAGRDAAWVRAVKRLAALNKTIVAVSDLVRQLLAERTYIAERLAQLTSAATEATSQEELGEQRDFDNFKRDDG